jgi:uncharacterized repeat protein (TIGR02543 family)
MREVSMKQRLQISITIVLLSFLLIGCDFLQNITTVETNEQSSSDIVSTDVTTTFLTDTSTSQETSTDFITTTIVQTTEDQTTTQATTTQAPTTQPTTTIAPTTTQPTTVTTTTLQSVTISFEENGGSEVADITEVVGTIIQEPVDPVMEGYNFLGWYTESELTNKFEFITMPESDLVLYAKWEAIIFTISFETNCDLTTSNISEPFETEISLPDLERIGYTFDGWFTDEELTNEIILSKMPTVNMSLYAKWTINQYTITFKEDGGTLIDDIIADYGSPIVEPSDPIKEGHTFDGWYTYGEFLEIYEFTTMPAENVTLHAMWTLNAYSVNYRYENNEIFKTETYNYGSDLLEPEQPVRAGYNFIGWYKNNELTEEYVYGKMPAHDIDVYAKFEVKEFTISFEENGGSLVADITQDYMSDVVSPENPEREGYIFGGWFKEPEFVNQYTFTTMPAEDLILYARWNVNEYTVIFYNHNDEVLDSQTVSYGLAANPPALEERFGYIFTGWNEDYTMITADIDIYPVYIIDSTDMTASFTDSNLLAEVLNSLGKQAGEPFTKLDLLTITNFSSSLEITNLDGMELLKNLEVLNLDNSRIDDASALSGLLKMNLLILNNLNITNVDFVENMTNMTFFVINFSTISDISAVSHLDSLQTLVLTSSPVVDLTPLQGLNHLETLLLSETDVSDLSPLFGIDSLRSLNVAYTNVMDITGLSTMTNLKELTLSGNPISSFEELETMIQLEYLTLYNTGIKSEDLVYLESLTNLKDLNLGNAMIYDISSLMLLPSSTTIRLWGFDTNPHIDGRYVAFDALLKDIKLVIETANSDIEKVLRVHDYINNVGEIQESMNRSITELLLNGGGLCAEYSNTTELLLTMLGIETMVIGGEGHAWNVVYIDDECYHMDGFWDEEYGYDYFMISDNKIESYRSGPMFDWTSPNVANPHPDLTCTSIRFEALASFLSGFAGNTEDVYLLEDSIIYFNPSTNEIIKTDYDFVTSTVLATDVDKLLEVFGGATMFYLSSLDDSVYLMGTNGILLSEFTDLFMVKDSSLIQNAMQVSVVDPYILTFNQAITSVDSSKIFYRDHLGNITNADATFSNNVLTVAPVEDLKSQRAYELVILEGALNNSVNSAINLDIYRYFFTEVVPEPYQFEVSYPTDGNLEYYQYFSWNNADNMSLFVLSDQPLEVNFERTRNITLSDSEGNIIMAQISVGSYDTYEWFLEIYSGKDSLVVGETYTVTIPFDFFKSKTDGSFAAEDYVTTVTVVDEVNN